MSETVIAYVLSVVILAALALFVPCIELLAKLLRTPIYDEDNPSVQDEKASDGSREVA